MQASRESTIGNVGGGSGSGDFNSRQASDGNVGGGSNHSILEYRYPELAKLAMDILCVPVSTVASKSGFTLGGRVLNEYRSSMKSAIVEAVICSRDWLFGEKGVNTHVDIDKLTQNVMDMNIAEDKTEVTSSNKL
uniref:HAT C-terminal dimerisation domain-containing protein n=1 Tax=Lactuca sativa TaxID=4236 RepID=A0A9R1VIH2_LACSA|nr:hypothetical protein LSAT_V11C500296370 [Lactuca sativa]